MPVGLGLDVCGAEVLPEIHHRVLRMQQEAAGGVPGLARTPLAWNPLTFVAAIDRRGERHPVVLVGLVDDSLAIGSQEVARDLEVLGRQVREAVRRHLVGDVEHLLEVLHGDVLGLVGFTQELHGRALGCKDGCGEVVRLDPLAEVVAEITGVAVVEGEMAEGLQHDAAGLPHLQPSPIRDEDDPIAHVGDAARGTGHVPDPLNGEAAPFSQFGENPLADRTRAAVASCSQSPTRKGLDLGEVIVAVPHLSAQGVVGSAGPLGEIGTALITTAAWPVADGVPHRHQVFEGLVGHLRRRLQMAQTKCPIGRVALRPLKLDLEIGPPVGCFVIEQRRRRGAEGVGEFLQ